MTTPLAPDRAFVRRLRGRVRQFVRANAVLAADRRRAPRRRNFAWLVPLLRAAVGLGLAAFISVGVPPETVTALPTIWATLITLHLAGRFQDAVTNRATLSPFFVLPTDEGDLFAQLMRERQRTAFWLALDFLAFGTGLALSTHTGWFAITAVPLFALAQGALALGIATCLVAVFPRVPFTLLTWTIGWCGWLASMIFKDEATAVGAAVAAVYRLLTHFTPAAWMMDEFLRATIDGHRFNVLAILPGFALLAALPWARRRLRAPGSLTLVS